MKARNSAITYLMGLEVDELNNRALQYGLEADDYATDEELIDAIVDLMYPEPVGV